MSRMNNILPLGKGILQCVRRLCSGVSALFRARSSLVSMKSLLGHGRMSKGEFLSGKYRLSEPPR